MERRLFQWVVIALFALTIHESPAQEAPVFDWTKQFGSTGGDFAYSITTDAAGNVYTTGYFTNTVDFDPGITVFNLTSAGSADIFISKVDANGNFVWAKSIGRATGEIAVSIATDPMGNVYATGSFGGTVDFDPGPGVFNLAALTALDEVFIVKLAGDGSFVWAHSIGTSIGAGAESKALDVDPAGFIYTTGYFAGTVDFNPGGGVFNLTSSGQNDEFVLKLDMNGNFVWATRLGAGGSEYGWELTTDAVGNVYTLGTFYNTVDFDPGPGVFNLTAVSGFDIFISKLDTDGNFAWAKSIGNAGNQNPTGIAVDGSGNVYVTGDFDGTMDFDPGPGIVNLSPGPSVDAFILKLDLGGTFVWVKVAASATGGCTSNSIAIDGSDKVTVAGWFNLTTDFDPGAGTFNLTVAGTSVFYLKLDENGNFMWATAVGPVGNSGLYNSVTTDPLGNVYGTAAFNGTGDFDGGACVNNLTGSSDFFVQKISLGAVIPPPTITSFTPTSGPVGTPVTITGTNFSITPANNTVMFNATNAIVSACTSTSIDTTVPAGATTGKISVIVGCVTVQSVTNFTVGAGPLPTISSFTPTSGPIGTTVTITGTNFSATPSSNTVKFNSTTATVSASSTTSITTTVPVGATTGTITVTVAGNTATSGSNFTVTATPVITITTQPLPASVCTGLPAAFTTAATGTTNITYQWQLRQPDLTYSDITNAGGFSGTSSSTLSVNTNGNFGAGTYRCRVNGDLAVQVITNVVSLSLLPLPAPPVTSTVTNCSSATFSLTASGGINGQYRWYTVSTGGSAIPGQTNNTYTTPVLTNSTTFYVSINNGTCESQRTPVLAEIKSCTPVITPPTLQTQVGGQTSVDIAPLVTTVNSPLDINSISVVQQPISGASAKVTLGVLEVDYTNIVFAGTDRLTLNACDMTAHCAQQEITIEVGGAVLVYNAISPNGDGTNEVFHLQNISAFPENKVTIFNRWGEVVFNMDRYDSQSRVFRGLDNSGNELPVGTYYYRIDFGSGTQPKSGYLSLRR